jgi:hypothetical protein
MLDVELNTLYPKSFDNIQDFFTKFKYFLLIFSECGIYKSTQYKQPILKILAKLRPEYAAYVSNFHFGRCLFGIIWKMTTLAWLIESLHTRVYKNHTHGLSSKIPKKMHSPCMMEKDHQNKMGRRNKMRRSDIPNPSMIL